MLDEVDKQNIRDHAEGKRAQGAAEYRVLENVKSYAKKLGATESEINDILHELTAT